MNIKLLLATALISLALFVGCTTTATTNTDSSPSTEGSSDDTGISSSDDCADTAAISLKTVSIIKECP